MIERFFALFDYLLIDKSIRISFPVKVSVNILISIFFILYFFWELYWYKQVGLSFIKWHTHLMVYAYPVFGGLLLFKLLYRKHASENAINAFVMINSVLFILFVLECGLVLFGLAQTAFEEQNGYYLSPRVVNSANYYNVPPPHKFSWSTSQEWNYGRHTNSLGFSDKEWPVAKRPGEKRILVLGDSFTEGVGAPADSNYVALLQDFFSSAGDSVLVMNAGTSGSDPFYNYVNLRDRLLKFKPDIIIQSIRSIDADQYFDERGGMERFQNNGTVLYKSTPFWEPLFAVSYVSRSFISVAKRIISNAKIFTSPNHTPQNVVSYTSLFDSYSGLCKANNIKLVLILHPGLDEVESGKYYFNLVPFLKSANVNPDITVIDLLPEFEAYIKEHNSTASDFYWKSNTHHNSTGYHMMAETVFKCIQPLIVSILL